MNYTTTIDSPLGTLVLVSDGTALSALLFGDTSDAEGLAGPCTADGEAAPFPQARREIEEYFAGQRKIFEFALAPRGTPFQQQVWQALDRIPYGATATYRDIARAVGSPGAMRAVGAANARNPLAIVVPCHRVIGSDGTLTGYAGGLARKKALLVLESKHGGCHNPKGSRKSGGTSRP
jgi:methylated-DNA-[protein]-cysteine S-methyltransferase